MTLADAAIEYASRGWYVLPLKSRDKVPATAHGFKDATTDPKTITAWWREMPDANIGISCGTSGLVVLDLDPRNGYEPEDLEDELSRISDTPEVLTGGGGRHLYFQHPGGTVRCRSNLRLGVDLKADGGYVVAPPSVHPSGRPYVWEASNGPDAVELAPCPAWLLNGLAVEDTKTAEAIKSAGGNNPTNPDAIGAAVGDMLRAQMTDGVDGSKRLYAYACRAVEHDLPDGSAIAAIRLCERLRPFPKAYSDSAIIARIRDAEREQPRKSHDSGAMEMTSANTVQPESVSWLWRNRIALGKLSLLTGDPGLGKSFISLDIASRVSRGTPFPDTLGHACESGNVIILSAEDGVADTIVPRLISTQADLERIVIVEGVRRPQTNGLDMFSLEQDLRHLEEAIERQGAKLIIIDPLSAYFGCHRDSHKDAEVRSIMAPLSKMVERRNIACLCVAHLNKQVTNTKAVYRSMGSLAFVAAVRSSWLVCKDKDEPQHRLLLPVKNNLAPSDLGGLRFHIANTPDGPVVEWHAGEVDMSADDGLTDPPKRKDTKVARAEEWLRKRLQTGPVASDTLEAEARDNGLWKKPYYDARDKLDVQAFAVRDPATGRIASMLSHLPGHECRAAELAVSVTKTQVNK